MFLQCKVCGKEFPEYDQRGFRNAGFTAHQNRCVSRANAASARATGDGSRDDTVDSSSGAIPSTRRPSQPRRLLPAPPRRSSQTPVSSPSSPAAAAVPVIVSPPLFMGNRLEFFPVHHCNYCVPQQYFHDPSCALLQFIMDLATDEAQPPYDSSSTQQ
ncbi:hypothetical protein BX666DRAFT_219534 [Dichotomocladium elegans]|nr:hypothetical protein BX666DRAFT_219534 [Dichotomocladium elegans]